MAIWMDTLVFVNLFICLPLSLIVAGQYSSKGLTTVPDNINTDIVDLNLNDNKIVTVDPQKLKGLDKLSKLSLSINLLTVFPNLTYVKDTLTEFEAKSNDISSINGEFLKVLTKLKILNLEANKLHSFPDVSELASSLEQLQLSNNKFVTPPSLRAIGRNLISLYLDKNSLSEVDVNGLDRINTFSVFGNLLPEFPDLHEIVDTVREIDLSKNQISKIQDSRFIFSSNDSTTGSKGLKIDLSENQLITVPPPGGTVKNIDISLYNNPLRCDFRIAWLIEVKGNLKTENLDNNDPSDDYYNSNLQIGTICASPGTLQGKYITELTYADLDISKELPKDVVSTSSIASLAQVNFYGISTKMTEAEVASWLECSSLCLPQRGCGFYNLKCLDKNKCLCHYSDPLGGIDVLQQPDSGVGWTYFAVN